MRKRTPMLNTWDRCTMDYRMHILWNHGIVNLAFFFILGSMLAMFPFSTFAQSQDEEAYQQAHYQWKVKNYEKAYPLFKQAYQATSDQETREAIITEYHDMITADLDQNHPTEWIALSSKYSLVDDASIETVISDLQEMNDLTRFYLAENVGFAPNNETTYELVKTLLNNDSPPVAALGIYIIGQKNLDILAKEIEPLLKSANPMVRTLACRTLLFFDYSLSDLVDLGYVAIQPDTFTMNERDAEVYLLLMKSGNSFFLRIIDLLTLNHIFKYLSSHVTLYNKKHTWETRTVFSPEYLSSRGVSSFASGLLNDNIDVVQRICEILKGHLNQPQTAEKRIQKSLVLMYIKHARHKLLPYDQETLTKLEDLAVYVDMLIDDTFSLPYATITEENCDFEWAL